MNQRVPGRVRRPGVTTVASLAAHAALAVAVSAVAVDDSILAQRSGATGVASFVTFSGGGPLAFPLAPGRERPEALDVLRAHGRLFGITDPAGQLAVDK